MEHELYNYDWSKEELKRLKEEIILKSPERFVGSNRAITDQTGIKVIKLSTNMRIINLERKLSAIEESLKRPIFAELFEYKYRKCLPWQQVIVKMNISESTYKRIRRNLVKDIAIRLGEWIE
jgi:RinA family phage transcriptional activator